MLSKLRMVDMLKAHLEKLDKELEKTEDTPSRVALMKEKGETLRALKDLAEG